MPGQRRASARQLELLVEFAESNPDIALGRFPGGPQAVQVSREMWNSITVQLNSVAEGTNKTSDQWRRYWIEFKAKTKGKAADSRRNAAATGGGPNRLMVLTELEKRMLAILGPVAVEGLPGVRLPINVEFNQPDLPILNRDNVGIVVKLAPRELPGSPVVVATTHLLYNPKRTDVRLAQMQVFLAEIDRFAYYDNGRESGHLPIIMTGDFNSTPDSAVIKLLDRGHVSASQYRDGSDWRRIGVTDNCQHLSVILNRQQGHDTKPIHIKIYNSEFCENKPQCCVQAPILEQFSTMFNSSDVRHSLKLGSVYESRCGATTFQDYWVTVDYIYFSCRSPLKLVERLRLPTEAECEVLGRLPNHVYGSDHLALAAAFELKPYRSTL